MSPHQTRNTGAVAIQSIVPIQSAMRLMRARSRITTTEYCCRSDFVGADCAAASSASSSVSGTGSSRVAARHATIEQCARPPAVLRRPAGRCRSGHAASVLSTDAFRPRNRCPAVMAVGDTLPGPAGESALLRHTCRKLPRAQGCAPDHGGERHAGTVRNASRADQSHPAGLGHAGGQRGDHRRHPVLGRSARRGQPRDVDDPGLRPACAATGASRWMRGRRS